MTIANTTSLDSGLPTLPSLARYPDSAVPTQVPHSHDTPLPSPSRIDPMASSSAHIYPPVPAYSPPSTNDVPTLVLSAPPEDSIDPDILQYTMAHDHGETAVARRLPEAFPSDLFSLRSSQGVPESLPPYGANEPPRYTRRIDNMKSEPKTLPMLFFKFGFIFPAFWALGSLMLITPLLRSSNPLSPISRWLTWPNVAFVSPCNENTQTEEDKAELLEKLQEVERMWAKRCLIALGLLACFAVALGITIFGVMRVNGPA